eukprot:6195566-Pleurochrysis_carterae.AAC.2
MLAMTPPPAQDLNPSPDEPGAVESRLSKPDSEVVLCASQVFNSEWSPAPACDLPQVLIYVFDIESRELSKDIEYYASCARAPPRPRGRFDDVFADEKRSLQVV